MADRVAQDRNLTEDYMINKAEKEEKHDREPEKNGEKPRCTAIILAAGSGSRMQSAVAKQFLPLKEKPLIWYALHAVEESRIIDDCILVTAEQDIPYVREEIVQKYHFTKVNIITSGGAERYLSVGRALQLIADGRLKVPNEHGYVFIHDGARPFLTEKILEDTYAAAVQYQACVAAVQSKDTVKISDGEGFALSTPDRRTVWNIQTPQVFETSLILQAYERLKNRLPRMQEQGIQVTDDASVVELFTETRVKLVEASYQNIKITTPEDMKTAEAFLEDKSSEDVPAVPLCISIKRLFYFSRMALGVTPYTFLKARRKVLELLYPTAIYNSFRLISVSLISLAASVMRIFSR